MKVQCPNCKRKDFETTKKYDPNVTPNGSFIRCLLPYHIDFLTSSTTLASELNCPECGCSLAPSGRLIVIPDLVAEPDPVVEPDPVIEPDVKKKKRKSLINKQVNFLYLNVTLLTLNTVSKL